MESESDKKMDAEVLEAYGDPYGELIATPEDSST